MKMTEIKEITSPLGDLSKLYLTKSSSGGGILDVPSRGIIELYPAGYTKPSNRDGCTRQHVHKALWEFAVSKNMEETAFPFGQGSHHITLLHDPDNQFDKNAIHLILNTPVDSILRPLHGKDLGFIPMRINAQLLKNIETIGSGRILKVKSNFHHKYYAAKIVLAYGNTSFDPPSTRSLSRFSAILED